MRTVATATDLDRCPRCDAPGLHHPASVSKRTQQAYSEFWSCNNLDIPCVGDQAPSSTRNFTLTWKSTRQWAFLHDQTSPPRG